jgi:hypothetical protein
LAEFPIVDEKLKNISLYINNTGHYLFGTGHIRHFFTLIAHNTFSASDSSFVFPGVRAVLQLAD